MAPSVCGEFVRSHLSWPHASPATPAGWGQAARKYAGRGGRSTRYGGRRVDGPHGAVSACHGRRPTLSPVRREQPHVNSPHRCATTPRDVHPPHIRVLRRTVAGVTSAVAPLWQERGFLGPPARAFRAWEIAFEPFGSWLCPKFFLRPSRSGPSTNLLPSAAGKQIMGRAFIGGSPMGFYSLALLTFS